MRIALLQFKTRAKSQGGAFIDGAGIGRRYLQGGRDSARNFAVLAVARAEKRKGEGRGINRLFIGTVILQNKLGFGLGEKSDGVGSSRAGAGLLPEEEDGPDERAPLVSGWRNCAAYPFGVKGKLGHGPFPGSGRIRSRGLFTFFYSFVFFLFSDFLFISHLLQ
jgi:hypothetical protein